MDGRDVIFTPLTDAMSLYSSRQVEMNEIHGQYNAQLANRHYARYLQGISTDHLRELTYADRKALHNFKYYTWVEQQGRSADELRQLWDEDFWTRIFSQDVVDEWDRLIEAFNE
jgi:acyl-CoA-binding protein